ncbi:SppA Periplasmic serine proteases (ClpP class) [Rhabdaerophilaceae bacterium]
MSLASDMMVDRRRLRRQLTFWRVAAILALIGGIVTTGLLLTQDRVGKTQAHIARMQIEGLITGKQETLDLIQDIEKSSASAVVLRISSGGGTTSGSEALYNEVRRLAAKKPVVAVIDGVGASGAYMTALGADRILANGSAIVGSIGVIAQIPNISKLLDTVGVKVESVRSSPLKAMPSGVEPTTSEARTALELTVNDTYRWFRELVGDRRKLEGEALANVTDGRVFTGRQSVELKLIDALGSERDAIAWLEAEKGITKNLVVREYKVRSQRRGFPGFSALHQVARLIGLPVPESVDAASERVLGAFALDGLVSVWQPGRE